MAVVGATALDASTLSQMIAAQPMVVLLDSTNLVFENPRFVDRIHEVVPDTRVVLIGMERDETTFSARYART